MKTKKSKFKQFQSKVILVTYHHYKDVTLLRVARFYVDGSTSVDCARTTSCIYHDIEKRAFLFDGKIIIEHIIHNYNYIS